MSNLLTQIIRENTRTLKSLFQKKLSFGALALASVLGPASVQAQTITRLVAPYLPIPNTAGLTFSTYTRVGTDGKTVVLIGRGGTCGDYGVYTLPITGGTLSRVVDCTIPAPGTTSNFTQFTNYAGVAPFVQGSRVVFLGYTGRFGLGGVFTGLTTGGGLLKVADQTTLVPGGPVAGVTNLYFDAETLSFNKNTVAFSSQANGSGVYTASTAALTRIANGNTCVGVIFQTCNFYTPSIDQGQVVYTGANVFGPTGIYAGLIVGGVVQSVATGATPDPGNVGFFLSFFGAPRLSGNNVLFSANNALFVGPPGLFLSSLTTGSSVAPILVANTNTIAPGTSSKFSEFYGYAISGNNIVFGALDPEHAGGVNGGGVYLFRNGRLFKIVAAGDVVEGQTLCSFDVGPQAITGNLLVFSAACGYDFKGIYLVNLGPTVNSVYLDGREAVLSGFGLADATGVRLNGIAVQGFRAVSDSELRVQVLRGLVLNRVTVVTPDGTADGDLN